MEKEEFLKKAKEMGYTQKLIDEIVKDMEKDIALGLPMQWENWLIKLPRVQRASEYFRKKQE